MKLGWNSRFTWWTFMILLSTLGTAWIVLSRAADNVTVSQDDRPPLPEKGFAAPDFTLEMLDGREMTLSNLRGQVILVNFWATWCPPCRKEMPAIQEVYDRYRDQGFVVLAVDLGDGDDQVRRFIEQMELTFPILMDRDRDVSRHYRILSIPTTYFVDRSGVIQDIVIGGPMPRALIESKVTALLAQDGDR
jgi:cytochrome c biogenesis protein CcmG/thiol:disulfide interchange protein DsbE